MGPIIRICSCVAGAALLLAAAPADARGTIADYVRARAAAAEGADRTALAGFSAALAADPNPVVALRAYRQALIVGDLPLALRALTILNAANQLPADAALLQLADAVARKDRRAVDAAFDRIAAGPFEFVLPILRAWRSIEARRDPYPDLRVGDANPLTRRYAGEQRELMLIATGEYDRAGLATLLAGGSAVMRDAADLLAGRGDRKGAAVLLAGAAPERRAKPTLGFGAARLLLRVADDLAGQGAAAGTIPIVFARSALLMEPGNQRGWLVLADALFRERATGAALSALAEIDPKGPFSAAAEALRIRAATSADPTRAVALAAEAADRVNASADTVGRHADTLMTAERFADAAVAYQRARDRRGGEPTVLDDLRIGNALDRAGSWAEAAPYLDRALAQAPDDPEVLNAVGYARLERGVDLSGARKLLERALAARPTDAAIVDSVGWAYLLTGEPARALPLLERAAAADPTDPVIAEHLGDALWALGRRFEARYAWRAAALDTAGSTATRLAARIAQGPPAR